MNRTMTCLTTRLISVRVRRSQIYRTSLKLVPIPWSSTCKHTGDDTYRQLAEKGVRAIIGLADPLPYLPAQEIDPSTGEFTDKYVVSSAFVANVTMIHLTDRHGEEDQIVTLSI